MRAPVTRPVLDLRIDRRALRAELARVQWWRRLVRGRIDVAVATVARPLTLGGPVAFSLPADVAVAVPHPDELLALLGADAPGPAAATGTGLVPAGAHGPGGTPGPTPDAKPDPTADADPDADPAVLAVRRLSGLRDLDARLATYEEGVARTLAHATAAIVERLAEDPEQVLTALREPLPVT